MNKLFCLFFTGIKSNFKFKKGNKSPPLAYSSELIASVEAKESGLHSHHTVELIKKDS